MKARSSILLALRFLLVHSYSALATWGHFVSLKRDGSFCLVEFS
jgi:hypothetical protein